MPPRIETMTEEPPERVRQEHLEVKDYWDLKAVSNAEQKNICEWLAYKAQTWYDASTDNRRPPNADAAAHQMKHCLNSIKEKYSRSENAVPASLMSASGNFAGGVATRGALWMQGIVAITLLIIEAAIMFFAVLVGNMSPVALVGPAVLVFGSVLCSWGLKDVFLHRERDLNEWLRLRDAKNHRGFIGVKTYVLLFAGLLCIAGGLFMRVAGLGTSLSTIKTVVITLALVVIAVVAAAYWEFHLIERARVLRLMYECQSHAATRQHGEPTTQNYYAGCFIQKIAEMAAAHMGWMATFRTECESQFGTAGQLPGGDAAAGPWNAGPSLGSGGRAQ